MRDDFAGRRRDLDLGVTAPHCEVQGYTGVGVDDTPDVVEPGDLFAVDFENDVAWHQSRLGGGAVLLDGSDHGQRRRGADEREQAQQ